MGFSPSLVHFVLSWGWSGQDKSSLECQSCLLKVPLVGLMTHLSDHGDIVGCFFISSCMDLSKFPELWHIPLLQGPVTASRSCGRGDNGFCNWGFCLILRVTCGLVRESWQGLPQGSQTSRMGFLPVSLSVTCTVSKAWGELWCLNWGLLLYLWNISFPVLLYFVFSLKLWAVARPLLKSSLSSLPFSCCFTWCFLPSIHHSVPNQESFARGEGRKKLEEIKGFILHGNLAESDASSQTQPVLGLPCTGGDLKKSLLARHPRTCFLLALSPWKCCALHQITFPDIPLASL